ncbi:uncharacterized protein LOC115455671 [Manduca sexta]|uniref:uncharacterized protein LOC115455671 n=1 Tax=Manduca sexta TaxID=7130 RepID=UPI00188F2F25|nr:uncharacterized protein LOC115455671 [Manduca sexta]
MDEEETKVCPNCKREIPGINFTTHTVHCARNLRVCRVCKEPVPVADLQRHHDELHKQLPCKQCGESVCGTDLEDHIRDSCANTVKSCRYCELELPRRELPAHEGYCGVRTEQCPDCREWVMIKYRQLHLDSNHGFIRLDDDPAPIPKKDPYKSNLNRPTASRNIPSTSNGFVPSSIFDNFVKSVERVERVGNNNDGSSSSGGSSLSESIGRSGGSGGSDSARSSSSGLGRKNTNGAQPPVKRTNDQPQININSASASKVDKDLGVSRGAVKKRMAPKPPAREPAPLPARDLPYYSAVDRKQREEKQRAEQNAYNLSVGLPPVLSPAAKIEKLRKMDALQNREAPDTDYKNRLRKDIWSTPTVDPGYVVGSGPSADAGPSNLRSNHNPRPLLSDTAGPSNLRLEPRLTRPNLPGPLDSEPSRPINLRPNISRIDSAPLNIDNPRPKNINGPAKNQSPKDVDMKLEELRNLKPMTPMEFAERFNELQMRPQERVERADRFSEIKSSLRELRRGLNEVTAPYNSNAAAINVNNGRSNRESGSASPEGEEVRLPCEFCGVAIPMDDLVQHQTGCRPDLAQLRCGAGAGAGAGAAAQAVDNALNHNSAEPLDDPVIPCEFCARSLPVYLISEHQERCGREANLLFAD